MNSYSAGFPMFTNYFRSLSTVLEDILPVMECDLPSSAVSKHDSGISCNKSRPSTTHYKIQILHFAHSMYRMMKGI